MPTTRKKVIKTVYKDSDDSEAGGDFSDSGSEAHISEDQASEDEEISEGSADDYEEETPVKKPKKSTTQRKPKPIPKPKFAKSFISKIKQDSLSSDEEGGEQTKKFSVKDMTEADKLLPAFLNLSESDSSDDEAPSTSKTNIEISNFGRNDSDEESQTQTKTDYIDIWSKNLHDNSAEIAQKTFLELEKHKQKLEETKASLQQYSNTMSGAKPSCSKELDVNDLLAQGEEVIEPEVVTLGKKKLGKKKARNDSDSDVEDWEEVNEARAIPQQGIQLIVDFPDAACKNRKKLDLEMMMKRRMNRVKKEYQVYMHKVHILCWIGHGNFISRVLNDQEILAAAVLLVPKGCYPGERVDMKYVEQITSWYKDKFTHKFDKSDDKYRPKAPPLKQILQNQIKSRVVTTKKYLVYIFVSMLRALGLQCRVMFNFVTLPIKPPSSELCSLSTKKQDDKKGTKKENEVETKKESQSKVKSGKCKKIKQLDGNDDSDSDDSFSNIMQLDGNDDASVKTRKSSRGKGKTSKIETDANEDVSPPKRVKLAETSENTDKNKVNIKDKLETSKTTKKSEPQIKPSPNKSRSKPNEKDADTKIEKIPSPRKTRRNTADSQTKTKIAKSETKNEKETKSNKNLVPVEEKKEISPRKTRNTKKDESDLKKETTPNKKTAKPQNIPDITLTNEDGTSSKYFNKDTPTNTKRLSLSRKRSKTSETTEVTESKVRSKSADVKNEKSKYFKEETSMNKTRSRPSKLDVAEDKLRVSHRDLSKSPKKNVKGDLVDIIKKRVKEAKEDSKKGIVKGKLKPDSDDSDYLPEETVKQRDSDTDDDFKPSLISPKPSSNKKVKDRRVLSSDEEAPKNKIDVWCEVYVEELEQWIAVDVVKARVHCTNEIYKNATHPVTYILGWDNNNYLKDLTRRYVPQWNTVTRKQRVDNSWWDDAVRPWLGPKTARDKEEDVQLDRMQLEAPLPKSIAEYKNHPLYALTRHLLKFEAIYPPDAATLGFVRNEPVYARECVYTCRSRDTWLKEAKVVKLGEKPYKIVKARPKWDRLSNKAITDRPLEVFGPWQVQDYEPPEAENGMVPRNAYGNVELFKECMLPKGTVHMKLPGLNKVAKKLNVDCAPAMTGFDYNGGYSHPVYDGFVVCKEFEDILIDAWEVEQVEQERKETEKLEARVYGNWKRLIKGLLIRERLKLKYGFEEPKPAPKKKVKEPRLLVGKRF